jgi:hypothetical protein
VIQEYESIYKTQKSLLGVTYDDLKQDVRKRKNYENAEIVSVIGGAIGASGGVALSFLCPQWYEQVEKIAGVPLGL